MVDDISAKKVSESKSSLLVLYFEALAIPIRCKICTNDNPVILQSGTSSV